jgi:hypothetical protein
MADRSNPSLYSRWARELRNSAVVLAACFTPSCRDWLSDVYTTRAVHLVLDSDRVRQLISQQEALQQKDRLGAQRYSTDEIALDREIENGRGTDKEPETVRRRMDIFDHPERYVPDRIAFLKTLAAEPGVDVPKDTHGARVGTTSSVICSTSPSENPALVMFEISKGELKGKRVWGCEGDSIVRGGIIYP